METMSGSAKPKISGVGAIRILRTHDQVWIPVVSVKKIVCEKKSFNRVRKTSFLSSAQLNILKTSDRATS